jgi:predicted DNA-binding transcriptional regulator AlpA
VSAVRAASPRSLARAREGLVDAATVAEYLGVERSWVYEHADELGARRLGFGPRARLRFSLADVDAALTGCTSGRGSNVPEAASPAGSRRRRRSATGTSGDLLPIRGRIVPPEGS